MTRDLHSAILFCAFLTASNNLLHASICANARPVFSTLFQTQKDRKKRQPRHLFDVPGFKDRHVKTSRPAFFDPSYLPHAYKVRYALKSLKRAANATSNSPTFLHPRVKNFHRHVRYPRHCSVPSRYITRPILESLLRRRAMSTEADIQPNHAQYTSPPSLHRSQSVEGSTTTSRKPRKSPLPPNISRALDKLNLERLAQEKGLPSRLRHLLPASDSYSSIRDLPPTLQIRLCVALLLTAFQLTESNSKTFPESSDLPIPSLRVFPQSRLFASTISQARIAWNAVDPTKIESERDSAYYRISGVQLLAFEGRLSDAETEIEQRANFKDELGVEPSWLVIQTYRIIFLISTLQRRPLGHTLSACLRNSNISSLLMVEQGISTLHLTRQYASLLQSQIFDALDQIPDLYAWYTALGPKSLNDPQRTNNVSFEEKEYRSLGVILLHYLINRLQSTRSVDSSSAKGGDLLTCMTNILHHFEPSKHPIRERLVVQCSLELNRCGYSDEAARLLSRISTSSPNAAYITSTLLAIAARKGDVLQALDLVATLRTSGALQKRDIRNLVSAYARAPIYEIGPTIRTVDDRGGSNGGMPDTELQLEEIIPDRINDAEDIFLEILAPHGPSLADYTIILDAYARRGDVAKVNAWIERMLDDGFLPDDIPWEKPLRALAVAGNVQGVVRMLDHMQGVNIRRKAARPDGDDGAAQKRLHRWSNVMSTSVLNILLELMAKRRDPLGANRLWRNVVFVGLTKPNFHSAVKLLRAHAEAGHWMGVIKAWKYLQSMESRQQAENTPNINTPHHAIAVYNTVLRAYVALGTPFPTVMGLFKQMVSEAQVLPDSFTYTMAIISATDGGDMGAAMSLFHEMEEQEAQRGLSVNDGLRLRTIDYRPIYALTYLLSGYLRQKQWQKARTVYHLIEQRGLKLLPLTYAVIIKSYTVPAARGDGDEGLKVAENFLTSLRSGWGNLPQGSEGEALPIKKERPSHDVAAYSPLMVDYVRQRKPEEVERLFEQMVQIGGDVPISGLTMLMDVYRRVGDVSGVRETWKTVLQIAMDVLEKEDLARQISNVGEERSTDSSLEEDKEALNLQPMNQNDYLRSSRALLCYPFSIFMDAISAVGSHEEVALEWQRLRDAGFSFDAHNWNHLVTVLIRAGEVEKAFEVVEGVIIPFALSSKQLASGDRLSWEMEENDCEVEEMPVVDEENVRWGRRRVSMKYESNPAQRAALEMAARQQTESGAQSNFVHELQLMQSVSRNWYQWKPHRSVLRILSKTLLHLESGRLILPLLPPGTAPETAENRVGSSSQAHALLERIRRRYPRTCKLAYDQVPAR